MTQRSFTKLLRAVSEFNGYPGADRTAQWEARLAVNAPELEAFFAASEPSAGHVATLPAATLAVLPEDSVGVAAEGIAVTAQQVRRGEVKAVDVVARALAAARDNRHLNAFITVGEQEALATAERIDRMAAVGQDPGPLAGVPIAVKDLMRVAGLPLTGGSRALPGETPTRDADAVARLRLAGAVIIGTTNLHELAYGITSDNPHFGRVVNPRFSDRIPGGSSGGSAAAVAAGIVAAAIGTDTAGSIRIPAACCGVVGFKPGYDAVSRCGVMNLAPSLDHVGPIAASVADAALVFEAMAGLPPTPGVGRGDLRGIRIARPAGHFFELLDAAVRAAVSGAIGRMVDDGARAGDAVIAGIDLAPAIQFMIICCEATQEHWALLKAHGDRLGDDVRIRLEVGQFLFGKDYVKAQRLRAALREALLAALGEADVMALPTLRTPAPPIGAASVPIGGIELPVHTAMTHLTLLFSLAGLPAITLPCGTDAGGLSIGLQLVAAPGRDLRLLAIARRCEALLRQSAK